MLMHARLLKKRYLGCVASCARLRARLPPLPPDPAEHARRCAGNNARDDDSSAVRCKSFVSRCAHMYPPHTVVRDTRARTHTHTHTHTHTSCHTQVGVKGRVGKNQEAIQAERIGKNQEAIQAERVSNLRISSRGISMIPIVHKISTILMCNQKKKQRAAHVWREYIGLNTRSLLAPIVSGPCFQWAN